ncbi:MAG: hypothetical protein ACE5MM_03460 [Nitrospiraceae bacterium]
MALAGHAGEMEIQLLMPHELMGGIVILALLILALLVLIGFVIRRLHHIERRLLTLEQTRSPHAGEAPRSYRNSPSPPPEGS